MKKKNINWQDLIDSDDEIPKASTRAARPAAKQPTTAAPAANTPASRADAISAWQTFHVEAQARQEAATAHLPSDYPVPSESSSANSAGSAPAGSLHRQGSGYRPERYDALIRRAQNKPVPGRAKPKVRSRFSSSATTVKRVVRFPVTSRTAFSVPRSAPIARSAPMPRSAPAPSRPTPVGPATNLYSVLATSAQLGAQLGAQKMQINTAREPPPTPVQRPPPPMYGTPQPSVKKVAVPNTPATPGRISFGLATSADLAAFMQGKPKPADATSAIPPPSSGLSASMHAPKTNPSRGNPPPSPIFFDPIQTSSANPPRVNASPSRGLSESAYAPKANDLPVSNDANIPSRNLESEQTKYAAMLKDFEDKCRLSESEVTTLRREKIKAEERAVKALADLEEAKLLHQEYRKRTEDHAKKIQKEWEKKEEEWTNREREWQAKQTQWQQAIASSRKDPASSEAKYTSVPPSSKSTVATPAPVPVPTLSAPVTAPAEIVWIPPYPASFNRGTLLFLVRLKVDPKQPQDLIQVYENDDVTQLSKMFASARKLGPLHETMIREQMASKRVDHYRKEEEKKAKERIGGKN